MIRAVRSVKETYAKGSGRTEAQALRDLVDPDLLILDEVGVQFGSDTEKLILFEIINGRYEASRPTIVISNLAAPRWRNILASDPSTDCARAATGWWCSIGHPTARGGQADGR